MAESGLVWAAAIAIPVLLIAPAIWNGYPLLQWDTGGYLARWYEGYLVPSRSTVFGLYLHFGEDSSFWINLGIQALATFWILQLTLRVLGMSEPLRLLGIALALVADHRPALACQHAADRHFHRPFGARAVRPGPAWRQDLGRREMRAVRLHRVLRGEPQRNARGAARALLPALVARPLLRGRISGAGLLQAWLSPRRGRRHAAVGEFRVVGRTRLDAGRLWRHLRTDAAGWHRRAISARPLSATTKFKLCPYRNELPATADQFLWGSSMFNTLGRFRGSERRDEGDRAGIASADYPAWQAQAALAATAQATDDGRDRRRHRWLDSPYLRDHRAIHPGATQADARSESAALAARFHRDQLIPRTGSAGIDAAARRDLCSARRVAPASTISRCSPAPSRCVLGNAFICAVISGPHDRYGARVAWIATFVVLIAAIRPLPATTTADRRRDRKSATPDL